VTSTHRTELRGERRDEMGKHLLPDFCTLHNLCP
jgi:hypothetical protein